MSTETIGNSHAGRKVISRQYLLSLFIALVFGLTMYPSKAQAQLVGDLEVNVPFQFHAGNTKLPAGQYRIHVLDNSTLTVMEISSVDGSTSALCEVQQAEASSTPAKTEFVVN